MFISMHVTVDDVNFCDSLECIYEKYKSRASTTRELLLIVCDMAFYAICNLLERGNCVFKPEVLEVIMV